MLNGVCGVVWCGLESQLAAAATTVVAVVVLLLLMFAMMESIDEDRRPRRRRESACLFWGFGRRIHKFSLSFGATRDFDSRMI